MGITDTPARHPCDYGLGLSNGRSVWPSGQRAARGMSVSTQQSPAPSGNEGTPNAVWDRRDPISCRPTFTGAADRGRRPGPRESTSVDDRGRRDDNPNMALRKFSDVVAQFPHVDDHDVLQKMESSPALGLALEMTRPRNWWGSGIDPTLLRTISEQDGIPVAWVPPANVLVGLVRASDRSERLEHLMTHQDEITAQCAELLAECCDPWLTDDQALVGKALDAYRQGHHEAAMALAVSVGEPLAAWASTPRVRAFENTTDRDAWEKIRAGSKYRWASKELATIGADISSYVFLESVLMAPIPRFFTPWTPESGKPAPEALSRNVVAHQATLAHFTRENALVGLMLDISILRAQQEWSQDVRTMDYEPPA